MKQLTIFIVAIVWVIEMSAQMKIDIWEHTNNHCSVECRVYKPKDVDKPAVAVIVLPGGSYFWLDSSAERTMVGEWLADNGIMAFVLDYRVAGTLEFITHSRVLHRGCRYPDALEDVQQTIALIRSNADEWLADSHKVGVMGFSAGGHLALCAGLWFDSPTIDVQVSLRPDFIVAAYPVVTLSNPDYVHLRSRRGLLGDKPSPQLCEALSIEKHVREDMPPVFLMNCVDDHIVKYQNCELLESALLQKNVSHRYLKFYTGGHGFGADDLKCNDECRQWKRVFLEWLDNL